MLFCLMLQWDAVEMMETSMTIVMSACLHTIILEIVAVMLMNSPLMVNGIRTMILLGLSLIYSYSCEFICTFIHELFKMCAIYIKHVNVHCNMLVQGFC